MGLATKSAEKSWETTVFYRMKQFLKDLMMQIVTGIQKS